MNKYPKSSEDITPQWLTYALKQSGILTDSSVKRIKKETIADGKAWLSNIIKVVPQYNLLEENLPESYILKMLVESRQFRDAAYEIGAYEREINFYTQLAKTMPVRLPKLFYSENGSNCNLMLMEDLTYLLPGDQLKGMKHKQVLTTLESLAKIHAVYWNSPILESMKWLPATNNVEVDYNEKWDSFLELCSYFLDAEGIKIGEKLKPHTSWLFQEISKRPKTLVHDDMKVDNLLFGESGTDEDVVILDWQFAIRSMAAIDVARLIGGSQTPRERNGRQFESLKHWHDKLLEQGVKGYSWEEAQRDFKLGALSCLTFPVHFHKGIVRAEGRALEYVKALYSRLFSHVVEIEAVSVLP